MREKLKDMLYPKVMIFPVTYKCNARCCMCNIWKNKSKNHISLNDIEKIFSDEIICENLESVNLTGGEPLLREDLLQVIRIIVQNCKKLKVITLNTNGYFYYKYEELFDKIDRLKKEIKDFQLLVYFSMDGLYEKHDEIRGVSGFFDNLMKTIKVMQTIEKKYNIKYSFNFTITPYNYKEMKRVFSFLNDMNLSLDFTLSMPSETYFNNTVIDDLWKYDNLKEQLEGEIFPASLGESAFDIADSIACIFNEYQGNKFDDLWKYDNEAIYQICSVLDELLKKEKLTYSRTYYRNLIKMLQGDNRKIGCIFKKEGLFISTDGNIYKCWADNHKLGNIYEKKVSQIWKESLLKYGVEEIERKCKNCYNNCYVNFQRNDSIKNLLNSINNNCN